MNDAPPSLRLLSEITGYSLGAVSMALRGDPRIAGKTREMILKAARSRGYEPDPLLAGRMRQIRRRSPRRREAVKLAHLVAWDHYESYYEFPPFREFREGAAARAKEFGYALEDFLLDDREMNSARLWSILRARACPGVLIAPVQHPFVEREQQGLEWPKLDFAAYSTIGYSMDMARVSRAVHDHTGAAELACSVLSARGHKRVGVVISEVMHRRVHGRWLAGWFCSQRHPYAAPRPLIAADPGNAATFDAWLKRERPDAILTCEWGAVSAHCARLGLRPGRDLGLVDLQWSASGEPRAGVDQCNLEVGAAAMDVLLAQINRHERGEPVIDKTILVPGKWVEGPTVRVSQSSSY